MAKTDSGLVKHAEAQLGMPYWWGTFGAVCGESLWQQKKKQYPSHYSDSRYKTAKAKHFGKRAYDCCGLVKSFMFQSAPTSAPKYAVKYDKNVGGLLAACSKTGPIKTIPETPGLLVFRGTAHVGIYIGQEQVIEAKGFDYGVVKTKLSAGKWDKWGQLSWITYTPTKKPVEKSATEIGSETASEQAIFKNTSEKELIVYADTSKLVKIGTLFKGSSCVSLGTKNNCAVILYQVSGTSSYKVGFTDYLKGLSK
ncbi:MAG: hypothetical protein GX824_00605 [Clostridiales bacterium]|jgi:hypothetical protein|nr:hypothetical protein [Clostridiales bacterium]